MFGIEGDREDRVRRALIGNKTDDQRVVIIVDHFEGAWESSAHYD